MNFNHPLYLAAKDCHTKKTARSPLSTVLLGVRARGVMARIGLALSGESKRTELESHNPKGPYGLKNPIVALGRLKSQRKIVFLIFSTFRTLIAES